MTSHFDNDIILLFIHNVGLYIYIYIYIFYLILALNKGTLQIVLANAEKEKNKSLVGHRLVCIADLQAFLILFFAYKGSDHTKHSNDISEIHFL